MKLETGNWKLEQDPSRKFRLSSVKSQVSTLGCTLLLYAAIGLLLILPLSARAGGADDLDSLIGGDRGKAAADDEITAVLDNQKPVTAEEMKKQMAAAMAETDAARQAKLFDAALASFIRCKDIVPESREVQLFMEALVDKASPEAMRSYAAKLLAARKQSFDPGAWMKLNLGVRLAFATGSGATLDDLKDLLATQADRLDVEWLLPAIGRIGGPAALPILQPYRSDNAIIPLGNVQNIQRVPCAAVLACAFAGDTNAFEKVLQWYEEDRIDLPRFAFYVSWAKLEGLKPDYVLLDYCQHRIHQAERLLDVVASKQLSDLIARTNRDMSRSLTGYLFKRLESAPPEDLPKYVSLLDHPSILMKRQVMDKLLESGSESVRQEAMRKLNALLKSPRGLDRFFAAETLWQIDPKANRSVLDQVVKDDPNETVRRRLQEVSSRSVL